MKTRNLILFSFAFAAMQAYGTTIPRITTNNVVNRSSADSIIVVKDQNAFAGAFLPSKDWQPPRDQQAIEKLTDFQDLKFGIMFNWGTQTLFKTIDQSWSLCPERFDWNRRPKPFSEATDWDTYRKAYEDLMKTFNPEQFDPREQVSVMKNSGAKYIVVDAKHHDGFCFFDTKTTGYRITAEACPYSTNKHANVMKEMLDQVRDNGLWTGIYFSKADWNVPYYWAPQFGRPTTRCENYDRKAFPDVWERFAQFTRDQLEELTTDYGKVDILWLDGGQVSGSSFDLASVAAKARKRNPGMLVVDRCNGGGYEDYITPEGVHQMPPAYCPDAWEACMSLGGHGWAWTELGEEKSAPTVIRYLVKATARNGNLLLGVGPDYNGVFSKRTVEVLDSIGSWLKVNGEAIYGTRPIAPYETGNVFFTQKRDGSTYAIVLSKTDNETAPGQVVIPSALIKKNSVVSVVGTNQVVPFKIGKKGFATIYLSKKNRPTGYAAWAFKISHR